MVQKPCVVPMYTSPETLRERSTRIIAEPVPHRKAALAEETAALWQAGALPPFDAAHVLAAPDNPGRPERPLLLPPAEMPKRRIGSPAGLIALVHSLVHIELNAIDMTWDTVARFADAPLPRAFLDEAVQVGLDEARHFVMINERLEQLGARYGDLPAHGNLWEAARTTSDDLMARLAIVPLVLEARGLDVSPAMIAQVEGAGHMGIAESLRVIYRDEITHVAFGARWFIHLCKERSLPPEASFQDLVRRYFRGAVKAPFNDEARRAAGLSEAFYKPLDRSYPTQS